MVHHRNVAFDHEARRIHRHQHDRMTMVGVALRRRRATSLADDEHQAAQRVRRAGHEPLSAVENQRVAIAADARLQLGRVGRTDIRFAHRKARPDLAAQQGIEPALALRRRSEQLQQLDVAAVGSAAVEDLGRPRYPAHALGQRRVVEVAQTRAGLVVAQRREEQIPQEQRARVRLQRLDDVQRINAGIGVTIPVAERGQDEVVHEALQLRLQGQGPRRGGEVHDSRRDRRLPWPDSGVGQPRPVGPGTKRGDPIREDGALLCALLRAAISRPISCRSPASSRLRASG